VIGVEGTCPATGVIPLAIVLDAVQAVVKLGVLVENAVEVVPNTVPFAAK
jgi:hypothetical protein